MARVTGRPTTIETELTTEQTRVYVLFLRVRHAVIALSGVSAFINSSLGPRAPQVALTLWFGMMPYNELLIRFVRRHHRVPWWIGLVDLFGVLLACLYEPTLFVPGLMLALGNLPLPAAVLPTRQAIGVGAASVGGFTAVALINHQRDLLSSLLAFVLAVPVLFMVVILLARRDQVETKRRSQVLDTTGSISWEYDLHRNVFTFVSGPTEEILGLSPEGWLDDPLAGPALIHPDDRATVSRHMFTEITLDAPQPEVRFVRKGAAIDDVGAWSWWRVVASRSADGAQLLGMLINVTDLHRAQAELRHQAAHDLLTGLPNRGAIRDAVQRLCESGRPVGLLLIDIDRFKEVNDALGHHVGDRLLSLIAGRLRTLDDVAVVGRLGGDEFAVVFDDRRASQARFHALDIHQHLTEVFDDDGMTLVVGASIGVATSSPACSTVEALFRGADAAMYQAKRAGGGVIEFVPGATRDSSRAVRLISDLHRKLLLDGIDIALQPIVCARTGAIVGAETLARWEHSDLGVVSPAEFIPLAEMSGQIHRVAESVLRQAIEAAAGWHAAGHHLDVSVNLSATNLLADGVVDLVERLPARLGLPWSALVLEITESQAMEQSDLVARALERFTRLGVRLSIDDFGTGHSSLGRLRQLPFSELKVDRSFISGVGQPGVDTAIVSAIVGVGHSIGMTVVAEGVETVVEVEAAKALGCDLLQGFGLFRPMSPSAFAEVLAGDRSGRWAQATTVSPLPSVTASDAVSPSTESHGAWQA